MGLFMFMAICSSLVPLYIFFKTNRNRNNTLLVVGGILVINLITDLTAFLIAFNGIHTEVLFQLYTIIIGGLFFLLYSFEFRNRYIDMVLGGITSMLVIYEILFVFKWVGDSYLDTYTFVSVVVITVSLIFFAYTFYYLEIEKLETDFFFWINSGVLVYFSSTFFITIFTKFIIDSKSEIHHDLWIIQNISTIIFNLIIAKGIWTLKKA